MSADDRGSRYPDLDGDRRSAEAGACQADKLSICAADIAKNTARSQPAQVIDSTTVDLKYIGPGRRFLDELANDGDIERNPALGIHSARTKSDRKKAAAITKRSPFAIAELNKILQLTSKLSRATADYWAPPCLLFTGMRVNEFAQLGTSDLIEHNGRPHLSVVCVQGRAPLRCSPARYAQRIGKRTRNR